MIELQALLSTAYGVIGSNVRARETMKSALRLGENLGYVRSFIDNSPEVYKSILRNRDQKVSVPANYKMCYDPAHQCQIGDSNLALNVKLNQDWALIEPLSKREEEVLQLLSSGLSNKEISKNLYIAVGTVKQHLKNIYSKLNVHSRLEAVYFAQTVGIL